MSDQPAFNLPEYYTNTISVSQPNVLAFYPAKEYQQYTSMQDYIQSLRDFAATLENVTVIVTLSASLYSGSVHQEANICSPGMPVLSDWKILCHETYQFQAQAASQLVIYSPGLDLTQERTNIIAIGDRSKYIKSFRK